MVTDIAQIGNIIGGSCEDAFIRADCMEGMKRFPDKFFELAIDTRTYACYNMLEVIFMRTSDMLQIGKAGEYLTCADLILKGFVAFPSEQGLPFDVVMDNGKRLLRIQVKTTEKPRIVPQRVSESNAYIFNIKRAGKNGKTRYDESDIDLFALVCLDTMKVGYLAAKDMPETINIRVDALKGTHRDEKGIKDFELVKEMHKTIKSQSEIARRTGMHVSTVNRMLMDGFEPYKTSARYFSDFERESEWFENI